MASYIGDPPHTSVTETHKTIADWFQGRAYVRDVYIQPSRQRAQKVLIVTDPGEFFEGPYSADIGHIEIEFRPEEEFRDKIRIQWVESAPEGMEDRYPSNDDLLPPPGFSISVGLHQHRTDHHEELDEPIHFQVERPDDGAAAVAGYSPEADTAIGLVDEFLRHVPYLVSEIREELGGNRVD